MDKPTLLVTRRLPPAVEARVARDFDANSYANNSLEDGRAFKAIVASQPLAIEPRKVSRTATVYAVFAIE